VNGASRVGLGAVAIAMLAAPLVRPAGGQPRPGDPIICPKGSERGAAQRSGGSEEWCARPGTNPRILDGPFVSRHSDGALETRGGFRDGMPIGSLEMFDPAGRMRSAVDFGADGKERSRRAWDEANHEIDPRSPEARDAEARAVASSRLIQMALMAASVWR
jgi:hypothetical protein